MERAKPGLKENWMDSLPVRPPGWCWKGGCSSTTAQRNPQAKPKEQRAQDFCCIASPLPAHKESLPFGGLQFSTSQDANVATRPRYAVANSLLRFANC